MPFRKWAGNFTDQPAFPVEIAPAYIPLGVWTRDYGRSLHGRYLNGAVANGTFSGTPNVSPAGRGYSHTVSTYEYFGNSKVLTAFPVVLAARFVYASSVGFGTSAVGLGGTGGSNLMGIGCTQGGATFDVGFRIDGGSFVIINGPTKQVGLVNNVILIVRGSGNIALWWNGINYPSAATTGAPTDLGQFTIGGTTRGGDVIVYAGTNISTSLAFYSNIDPGDAWARAWSLNPWTLFDNPRRRRIISGAAAGGGFIASSAYQNGQVIGAGVF